MSFKKYNKRKQRICKCTHYSFEHRLIPNGWSGFNSYGRCEKCMCDGYDEIEATEEEIRRIRD